MKLDNYLIPKTEDLLTTLGGSQKFTKLDMPQAYQQLLLEDESKQYTMHNKHTQGLILVQPSTIWGVISTGNIPTNNGEPIAWHTLYYCTR